MKKKLKPVIIKESKYLYNNDNVFQQNLLLRSLKITSDPEKLKKLIGVKTVADVFRTLDKISMRKEYHEALMRNGIDLDTIINGIKDLCYTAKKDDTRLKGWQILLKSLGLDSYDSSDGEASETWEDELLKRLDYEHLEGKLPAPKKYEVREPEVPEEVKQRMELERELGKKIYE